MFIGAGNADQVDEAILVAEAHVNFNSSDECDIMIWLAPYAAIMPSATPIVVSSRFSTWK